MTPEGMIAQLGGDLKAVVIVALAVAVVWLARRNQEIQECRLTDLREASKQSAELVRETNKAMEALTNSLRGAGRG